MTTTQQGKKASHIGPHWPGGDTPIKVGSYTKIKPIVDEGRCIAPCKLACPAGTDIQGFIALLTEGQYKEALKLIKKTNPLPLVIGRVCPSFCETKCRREKADEAIDITALERFVADSAGDNYVPEVKPATGHKAAIIGGGPAGLTAAYYLAIEGHQVAIFDANPELGGMLRYSIPDYRLPKTILDKEVAGITNICNEIHCGLSLGRDYTIAELKKRGYDAIFIGIGVQVDKKMGVEGESLPGVLSAIRFLRDVATDTKVDLKGKTVVIGGGNAAVDVARTALRLGAKDVEMVCLEQRHEMPALKEEIEATLEEGITIRNGWGPRRILGNRTVEAIELKSCTSVFDEDGRFNPTYDEAKLTKLKADRVIVAIGQTLDKQVLNHIEVERGRLKATPITMETSITGVFAGGDCVSGSATVVEAIAAGRRAAMAINQYLSGQPVVSLGKPLAFTKGEFDEIIVSESEEVKPEKRVKMRVLAEAKRKLNFDEVNRGFTNQMAKKEAQRCLQCGACHFCWLFCPDGAITIKGNGVQKPEVNYDLCKACGICAKECPLKAIELKSIE